MPVLTSSGPPAVTDLAGRLVADLADGRTARQSVGSKDAAFGWTTGLPDIVARHTAAVGVEGRTFNAVLVAPSGTPAAKVAEKAVKPAAVTITSTPVALNKYAGIANFTTEQSVDTDSLVPALAAIISTSALLAYDADCVTVLGTQHGETATGATWPEAILSGIGIVSANGGSPGLLVLSAADYASAVMSPGVGYASDPATGVVALFGLPIVLASSLAAGTGYVMDPAGALAAEGDGPFAVVDPYTGLGTNEIRLGVDYFAGFVVTSPGVVCQITSTAAASASSGK